MDKVSLTDIRRYIRRAADVLRQIHDDKSSILASSAHRWTSIFDGCSLGEFLIAVGCKHKGSKELKVLFNYLFNIALLSDDVDALDVLLKSSRKLEISPDINSYIYTTLIYLKNFQGRLGDRAIGKAIHYSHLALSVGESANAFYAVALAYWFADRPLSALWIALSAPLSGEPSSLIHTLVCLVLDSLGLSHLIDDYQSLVENAPSRLAHVIAKNTILSFLNLTYSFIGSDVDYLVKGWGDMRSIAAHCAVLRGRSPQPWHPGLVN
mgnify:CR=1 FL=1